MEKIEKVSTKRDKSGDVTVENGVQVVRMDVDSGGYTPNTFIIQRNSPVKWIVNGKNVFGCQGFLNVPELKIAQALKQGENIFNFSVDKIGQIGFSCSTNVVQGKFIAV